MSVDRVFVAVQFAGVFNLFVVAGSCKPFGCKLFCNLVNVADVRNGYYLVVEAIGVVVRNVIQAEVEVRV